MNSNPLIFDHERVRQHYQQASEPFMLNLLLQRVAERLDEIKQSFETTIYVGSCLDKAAHKLPGNVQQLELLGGAEYLEAEPQSADLCVAVENLHWINDLPGALVQIQRTLKPDGLFLGIMPGGRTLHELRGAFEKAELEIIGGVSPHISPFVDSREAAGLLQRAGFAEPVADTDTLTLEYDHPLKLLKELRAMGQGNALLSSRKHFTRCDIMMLMADIYMREYMNEAGRIPATVELVTLTAWKH